MASDKYRLAESTSKAFEDCNYAFTSYFAMELLLKIFGDGPKVRPHALFIWINRHEIHLLSRSERTGKTWLISAWHGS